MLRYLNDLRKQTVLGLRQGSQKPGFYENTSLQRVDLLKNPVSLVKERKSRV